MQCLVSLFLVVTTSVIDCLERLISEMTYVLCVEWGVKPITLTHSMNAFYFECCHLFLRAIVKLVLEY